ncbi:MAG TPA: ABC transporter ATP-binding protein [Parafilimonas sp.]|nr:ABC transporter ATP-binding protein [Parafilimonas sp.]
MIRFNLQKKLFAADGTMQLNVSCSIDAGRFVSLYGTSGAGKTSILRMLAGFLKPDNGQIQFDDDVWFDHQNKIDVPPQKRNIGFVFQDYALFPNMTVKENLQFALKKGEAQTIIRELMDLTELESLSNRNVLTLSGGQKQRVALARALVRKPKLLLLDEPLSAIDNELRVKLQDILMRLHRNYDLTAILVSHDITELSRLSDEIFLIDAGTIKIHGSPAEIFYSEDNHSNKVTGSIAEIRKEASTWFLYIAVGNQLLKQPVAENDINEFAKGDKVVFTPSGPGIQKLRL